MHTSNTYKKKMARQGFLSVLPVIAIMLAVRAYPITVAFVKSFTDWDGLFSNNFVGLSNYVDLLSDGEFWRLLLNNLILLIHIPIQMFLGFVFSVLLYEEIPGWRFFRSVSFMPQIISTVIIGYLFRMFFATDGPVNIALRSLGLNIFSVEWLGNGFTGLVVVIICMVWQGLGWQSLLIFGGMSGMDPAVLEAARIDGAGYWTRLFKIIIPMLSRVVEYSLVVSIIWVFTGSFNFIFTVTGGGPGFETTTIDYMIYIKAFVTGTKMGSACALAVILLIIVLIFTKIQMVFSERINDWND